MSYKTRWFTTKEVKAIARRFDVDSRIDLRDEDSKGRPCRGAYGANIENKLSRFVEDMHTVRMLLSQGDWSNY